MPLNKNAAFRYRAIDKCLRNPRKPFPSIDDLQEYVSEKLDLESGISTSSLNKDIRVMKDKFNAPIKFNKERGGYYYDDPNFSVDSFPLTEEEINALDLSISFLKQIKFSGFFEQFESAIEKIISGFRISKIEGYQHKKFIETEEPTADTGIHWLEEVYQAILMRNVLEVNYLKFNSEEPKLHLLSPYVIREYRNRWYVTGHSNRSEGIVTLALDRIHSIQPSQNKHTIIPEFEPDAYFRHAFGVTTYANAKPSKVKLLFCKEQRGYLESKPIHATQKIQDHADGFLVELECYLTPELEMYILSQGELANVLAPEELRIRIQERVQAMNKLYKIESGKTKN
jgi:predicted DNA-binding transcriptional regulator YafY